MFYSVISEQVIRATDCRAQDSALAEALVSGGRGSPRNGDNSRAAGAVLQRAAVEGPSEGPPLASVRL